MTQRTPPQRYAIRWPRVAVTVSAIASCAVLAAWLWPQPSPLPKPLHIIEPPPPFEPSASYRSANDLAVLKAALSGWCHAKGLEVLSTEPDNGRGGRGKGALPEGLDCPSIKIVDSKEIEALFKREYRGKKDFKHLDGWGNFYETYPDVLGILSVSLPSYVSSSSAIVAVGASCGYTCGAGWKIRLVKKGERWLVREQSPAWIA